jgi:CPA1 family monovalent cation:H+ antiporter
VHYELILVGLLATIAALAVVAHKSRVPYPILLVLGGTAIGFVPAIPTIELQPNVVLVIFLPPLLYAAALFVSVRELRRNLRPIGLLAIGLVLATTVGVALAAHYLVGMGWPAAFVVGAIVSPTDSVAGGEILRRLGVPRRALTILEGESLTNDWTALVLYKFAIAAVVTGTFSLAEAGGQFILTGVGGVAVGLAVGWVTKQVRARLDDPPTEITISLLTGYAAYLPAEQLGFSGVIAAVTVGLYMGWHASRLTTATVRIQTYAFWEVLQFLLNAFLFVLIGLQWPVVLARLSDIPALRLVAYGLLISGLVVVIRVVWVFILTYLPRLLSEQLRMRDPYPSPRVVMVIAWSGMRGAVSMAAALAIPLAVAGGGPFPDRDLIVFLTFCVIAVTLVGQGLTLPLVIKLLRVERDDLDAREERYARVHAARAASRRIEELAEAEWTYDDTIERLRGLYEYRATRFELGPDHEKGAKLEARSQTYARTLRELIEAQREVLIELRNSGTITDEVMRTVEHDLDLEEVRLSGESA